MNGTPHTAVLLAQVHDIYARLGIDTRPDPEADRAALATCREWVEEYRPVWGPDGTHSDDEQQCQYWSDVARIVELVEAGL